jgi:nucleotide-binding universal stress UspA family protein
MERILVCLDASPRAPLVLAAAADLAHRTGAKLSLLRSVGIPPEMERLVSVERGADLIETLTTNAKSELETLAKSIPERSLEGLHVHIGTPWDTICREATTLDADVVVLGSHGYSGFDRILGTTAAKVVNHCDRSVFVVRPHPGQRK